MQTTENFSAPGQSARVFDESTRSAVSWGAVIAGAVIAAALMATLVTGGTGLGLLAVSPWQNDGASVTTVAVGTILWMFLTHIIAYGIAGYVTGRLRTKWTDPRSDEIYFRDTAHGFLVWALSVAVGLVVYGFMVGSVISGTAKVGTQAVSAAAGQLASVDDPAASMDYFADALLRSGGMDAGVREGDDRREVALILSTSVVKGEISEADQTYLVRLISQRADIDESEARARLNEIGGQAQQTFEEAETKAREAADAARKYAAAFSLWAFAALLLGAFVASFSATIGGRARDL
ncbi:hypothetical protein [Pusillimonas sp.]|uniref:hypothetical protein n=1 Tax=Pusillimonas sp. TaxID=3040095 RepID=UPI0037C77CB9